MLETTLCQVMIGSNDHRRHHHVTSSSLVTYLTLSFKVPETSNNEANDRIPFRIIIQLLPLSLTEALLSS